MKTPKIIESVRHSVGRLSPFIAPYKKGFFFAVLCIILSTAIQAAGPRVEGLITTKLMEDVLGMSSGVIAGIDFTYIFRILVFLLFLYLSNMVTVYLYNYVLARVIQNSMRDLRGRVEGKIRKLPVSYFDKNSVGDVLSRITNDVDTISNALQQSFAQIINAVLAITLALVMTYSINWQLAIIVTLLIPSSVLVSKFVIKHSQSLFNKQQNALGRLNGTVQEMFTGFNEIKLYGREQKAEQDFRQANQDLCGHGFKAQFVSGLMNPLVSLLTYLCIALVAVFGSMFALAGTLTIGNLQAFIRYIWQVNQPMSQVTQLSSALQSAFAAITRVTEILDEPEELPDPEPGVKLENLRGEVSFSHVKFGYDKNPLIHDLNVEVKSGQMVAIVGPTGAGKTTLINLLMRFYDVQGGAIKIDGVDIRQMRREDLRGLFGMVLQDTWLFSGSIHENISYGKLDATRAQVVEAAKAANVHHFIRTLTDGYDMVLNEEASNISQGEKQLLTIARAFLADPPILILDEATSSVDTRLEMRLQKAMHNVMKGRTSFVIAHRLSTIRNADLILVINSGDIVEQGTHDELIQQKGFYEKLYNSQFRHGAEA